MICTSRKFSCGYISSAFCMFFWWVFFIPKCAKTFCLHRTQIKFIWVKIGSEIERFWPLTDNKRSKLGSWWNMFLYLCYLIDSSFWPVGPWTFLNFFVVWLRNFSGWQHQTSCVTFYTRNVNDRVKPIFIQRCWCKKRMFMWKWMTSVQLVKVQCFANGHHSICKECRISVVFAPKRLIFTLSKIYMYG